MAKIFLLTLFLALVLSSLWCLFRGALPNPPRTSEEEQDRILREAIAARDRARGELVAWLFGLPALLWYLIRGRILQRARRAKDAFRFL